MSYNRSGSSFLADQGKQTRPSRSKPRLPVFQRFAFSVGHVLNDTVLGAWVSYLLIFQTISLWSCAGQGSISYSKRKDKQTVVICTRYVSFVTFPYIIVFPVIPHILPSVSSYPALTPNPTRGQGTRQVSSRHILLPTFLMSIVKEFGHSS